MSRLQVFRNPLLQQYLLELLLPVVGYYLLDWSIVIICLYYLIDYLATLVMFVRRFFAVNRQGVDALSSALIFAVLGLLALVFIAFIALSFYFLMSLGKLNLDALMQEIGEAFFSELWILIPLVFIASIFKDRLTFFVPRRFLIYNPYRYLWGELILNVVFTSLLALFVWFTLDYSVPESLLVPFFLIGKIGFDLFVRSKVRRWSLNG